MMYHCPVTKTLYHYRKEINLLKEKQKEMNLKIFLNRSKKHTRKDQENAKKLCELTEAQNKYDRLIEEEKNLISDLDIKVCWM